MSRWISDRYEKIYNKKLDEFSDGSDRTLFKCLTHANRTFNLMYNFIKSGVQVSIDIRPTLELSKILYKIFSKKIIKKAIHSCFKRTRFIVEIGSC